MNNKKNKLYPDEDNKGEQKEKTYTAFINKDDLGEQVLDLPDELLKKMGWEPGDIIGIEETMNCFDDGECQGLVLTNLSKEK
jgi:hypothetical protein